MIKKIFITWIISTFTLIVNSFISASCYKSYGEWEWNYLHCDAMSLDYVYSNNWYQIWWFKDTYFNFTDFKFIFNIPEVWNIFTYWWQNDWLNYTYRTKSLNNWQYWRIKWFFYSSHWVWGNRSDIYLKDDQSFTYIEWLENLSNYLNDTFKYAYFYCWDESLNCKICLSDKNSASDTNGKAICVDRSYINSKWSYIWITWVNKLAINNPYFTQRNKNQVCPTLWQILNNYPTNYNTWLCYNNTLKYENGQIETIEKENIQQIFTNYEELSNRRNIYNNNCKPPYTSENCNQVFSWQRKKYSIISNWVNQNTEQKRLRNYCNIYLNYDLNMSSCIASGRQWINFTTEEITNSILSLDNLTVQTPKTWNILNWLLNEWEERANPLDILGNIEQIKDKFTILFEERNGVNGIIPAYIIWIMLLTILLTVLFKK